MATLVALHSNCISDFCSQGEPICLFILVSPVPNAVSGTLLNDVGVPISCSIQVQV